jgi:hypothetical protein
VLTRSLSSSERKLSTASAPKHLVSGEPLDLGLLDEHELEGYERGALYVPQLLGRVGSGE